MDLTGEQKKTIAAAFLGWMLDSFDFFLLTFLLKDIAKEFGVEVPAVAYALFLTLPWRCGSSARSSSAGWAIDGDASRR